MTRRIFSRSYLYKCLESWHLLLCTCGVMMTFAQSERRFTPALINPCHQTRWHPFPSENSIYAMFRRCTNEVASLPSIFPRISILLAPCGEPNPAVGWMQGRGVGKAWGGGAGRGHLGIPSATWLWLRLFRPGNLQRAITDDRPQRWGQRLRRRLEWRGSLLIIGSC